MTRRRLVRACDLDRLGGALVRVDAAEEQQVLAAHGVERKVLERDAVVDRRGVAQVGMAIGVADGDVRDAILIALEDRHDPLGREAVDRRHERGVDEAREGERHEVGLVVDEIELARALEDVSDVEQLPDLGVDGRVLGVGTRAHAGERAGRERVERREQRDVDAAGDERLGEQAGDELPGAVVARRRAPRDRREHGDTHGWLLQTGGGWTQGRAPSSGRSTRRSPVAAASLSAVTVERSPCEPCAHAGSVSSCGCRRD